MSLEDIANNVASEQMPSATVTVQQQQQNNNFFKRKNLFKFFTSSSKSSSLTSGGSSKRVPFNNDNSSKHKGDYLCLEFNLKRTSGSVDYGFTITGYCPCQIGRVEANSIAYRVGLQCGDQIIKIDSDCVSRATSDSIVKLIKSSPECLTITVKRPLCNVSTNSTASSSAVTPQSSIASTSLKRSLMQMGKKFMDGDNASMGIINSTENDFLFKSQVSDRQIRSLLLNSQNEPLMSQQQQQQIESFKSEDFIYGGGNHLLSIHQHKQQRRGGATPSRTVNQHHQNSGTNSIGKQRVQQQQQSATKPHHHRPRHHSNTHRRQRTKQLKCNKLNKTNSSCATSDNSSRSPSPSHIATKASHQQQRVSSSSEYVSDTSRRTSMHLPSPIPFLPPIKSTNLNPRTIIKSTLTDSDYKTQSSSTTDLGSSANDNLKHNMNQLQQDDYNEEFDSDRMDACEKLLNIEEKFIELMQKGVQQYSRPLRHCMMINSSQHHILFQNIEKILAISEYQLNQLISQDDSNFIDMFNSIGKLYENKMRMSCEAFDIYLTGVEQSFTLLDNLIRTINFSKFIQDSEDDINMDLKTFLLLPLKYILNLYQCLETIRDRTKNKINNDYVFINNVLKNLHVYYTKAINVFKKYNTPIEATLPVTQQQQQQRFLIFSSKLYYTSNDVSQKKPNKAYTLLFNDILAFMSKQFDESQVDDCAQYIKEYIELKNIVQMDFDLDMNEFQIKLNTNRIVTLKALSLEEKHTWKKLLTQRINQLNKKI